MSVMVHKKMATSRLGIVLRGTPLEPPTIKEIKEDGCAGPAAKLKLMHVDQVLVAVNGEKVYGHEKATMLLKSGIGDITLLLGEKADPTGPTSETTVAVPVAPAAPTAPAEPDAAPAEPVAARAAPAQEEAQAAHATAPAAEKPKKSRRGRGDKGEKGAARGSAAVNGASASGEVVADSVTAMEAVAPTAEAVAATGGRVMTLCLHKQTLDSKLGVVLVGGEGGRAA